MQGIEQFIKHLAERDIKFVAEHANPYGWAQVYIPAADLPRYVADPPAFLATHYGVMRHQYLAWHESEHTVRCAGHTKAGKPCKNVVPNGVAVPPATWVSLQGSFCHLHR